MSGDGDGMPERWIEQHAGCACSRFTDFSVACGKELVSGIEHVVRRALPASTGVPTVVWIDNGDTDGSVACEAESGIEVIYLAKASCVTWTTTLLAYVHALSHVLCRMICNFLCAGTILVSRRRTHAMVWIGDEPWTGSKPILSVMQNI